MTYAPKYRPDPQLDLAPRISSVATMTALKAIPAKQRDHGSVKHVEADNSSWWFHSTSALTGDDVLVAEPASGSGAWLRMPGRAYLVLPFTFATADATALLTLQAGQQIRLWDLYWEIAADMTGGSSSAIGVSSNKTGYSTKGDLLGGASGDVAASLTLALSPTVGTIGAKVDGDDARAIFIEANTIRFDRITSAFAAGSGNVVVVADILKNAGA